MLSGVINTDIAIDVNLQIIRVFMRMREVLLTHKDLLLKIEKLEKDSMKHGEFIGKHENAIKIIFEALKKLLETPKTEVKKIGYKRKDEAE